MSEWLKRDPANGCLIGPDGCHYHNEYQAAHHGLLKLCGCGNPEEAFNFCREALACFDRRGVHDEPPTRAWIDAEEALTSIVKNSPEQAAHVIAHLLTNLRLLEHGSTVGGSWPTDDGVRIIDMGLVTAEQMDEGD